MPAAEDPSTDATDHPHREPSRRPATDDGRRTIVDWVLWATLRLILLGIVAEVIGWPEQTNDLNIYGDWVTGSLQFGRFPTDEMWQYPPLAGPTMLLGAWLPGQRMGFALLFLAFDVAIMAMLSAQARRTGLGGGRRLWALLPVVVGPLLLARFDVVPTAFAVGAVLLAGHPLLSGAVAAIGGWLKVWPVLVLAGLHRRDLPRAALGALLASVAIAAVLVLSTSDPLSFLRGQRDRGLQIESVAAWPFLLARAFGAPVEVIYRYGAHEVEAAGVGVAATLVTFGTVLLLGTVAVQRLRGALEHVPPADVALATVLFTVTTSRVFSGQYFIWLLGLSAVAMGTGNSRMRGTIRLVVAAGIATHLIYPWLYSALLEGHVVAVVAQSLRIGLTLAATVAAVVVLLRPDPAGLRPDPAGQGGPDRSSARR